MTSNDDFSEDLLIEILSRLPVKSLMRYKFVCRFLCALIKSPRFVSRHIINYNDDNTRLVVEKVPGYDEGPPYVLFHDETLVDLSNDERFEPPTRHDHELLGNCNGLFCLHDKNSNRISIWNLATREFRALPKWKGEIPRHKWVYQLNFGFELDSSSNDYKIIFILNVTDDNTRKDSVSTEVILHTLSTDSWRYLKANELSDYSFLGGQQSENTFLDRICYWIAWRYNNCQEILSFHMRDEAFHVIKCPDNSYFPNPILGIYDNSLHFLDFDRSESCFEKWVMKEGSWTKQLSVGPILGVLRALEFWKNGSFFIESNTKQLLLYDPNTRALRDVGLGTDGLFLHRYKESLISTEWEDWVVDFFDIPIPWHLLGVYQTDFDSS